MKQPEIEIPVSCHPFHHFFTKHNEPPLLTFVDLPASQGNHNLRLNLRKILEICQHTNTDKLALVTHLSSNIKIKINQGDVRSHCNPVLGICGKIKKKKAPFKMQLSEQKKKL